MLLQAFWLKTSGALGTVGAIAGGVGVVQLLWALGKNLLENPRNK